MIWQCMESEPKVNFALRFITCNILTGAVQINNEKFAQMAGYTNPKSASNAWANIKKKLGIGAVKKATDTDSPTKTDFDDGDEAAIKTPTTGSKKRKAKGDDETPSRKGRSRKKEDVKVEEEDDEDAAETGAYDERVAVKNEPVAEGGDDGDEY